MSFVAYQSLIDQFCAHAGLPDARAMYHGAEFQIGETDFLLCHGGKRAPEMATVYCALGGLPPAPQREAALLRLLESNLLLFASANNAAFSFNAESQQVTLTCSIWLGDASGLRVLELLTRFDAIAKDWRASFFLTAQESQDAAARVPSAARGHRGLPAHLARAFADAGQTA